MEVISLIPYSDINAYHLSPLSLSEWHNQFYFLFRIAQQGLRKHRMQERWGNMKEEIWSILQYKDMAEKKADNRPEIVCTIYYQ